MLLKNITSFIFHCIVLLIVGSFAGTAVAQQHHMHQETTPLTEAGNSIFGTIQEVVQKLEADPNTDWSQVDLETLRQHLLDMKAFTEEVKVISKQPIEQGTKMTVLPTTKRAIAALEKLLRMHPDMLKREKGWDMTASRDGDRWTIKCTSGKESDVNKIRALGYIGLLAEGSHHQRHHWMIATGQMKMK